MNRCKVHRKLKLSKFQKPISSDFKQRAMCDCTYVCVLYSGDCTYVCVM